MGVIAKYKFNQNVYANFIPEFNSEFTNYTITDETDTDGYTIRTIESDTLPTLIRFGSNDSSGEGDYTKQSSLLEVNNLNTINVTDMSLMFYRCTNLTYINTNFNTSKVTDMYAMFSTCSSLTSLDVSSFDTSKVITMYSIFRDCPKLTSLDVSNFNTSNVDSMYCMFYNCSSLTSLDVSNFNTSNVTNMINMFYYCKLLTSLDLSNFNTSQVTSMSAMFHSCFSLTSLNVSNFNTSKVTNMNSMFNNCSSLTSLDLSNFDTSKVTATQYMFGNCTSLTSLDVSSFNTSNVTNMQYMFSNCKSLTSLDVSGLNTSKVTSMQYMFYDCRVLTSLDVSSFNTSKVTNFAEMFRNCSSLISLDLSSFDIKQATNISWMFGSCSSLTLLDVSNFNISDSLNIANMLIYCPKLINIGMIYCNSYTINKIVDLLTTNTTIWYQDAKLNELTPLSNITYKEYKCVEVQQDVDSIPLTSDMFEQNGWLTGDILRGMSLQQIATHTATSRVRVKSLIPVKPNKIYEILGNITGWALMFDKNGGLISPTVTKVVDGITTFSTTYETYYLAPVLKHSDDSNISPSDLDSMNLILQEVPQEIVLRGIGDVKDELDLTRGEYIQRIDEVVLDGYSSIETWTLNNTDNPELITFAIPNVKLDFVDHAYTQAYCYLNSDKFNVDYNYKNNRCILTHNDTTAGIKWLLITVKRTELSTLDVAGFRSYLSLNPITVQYVLATPIVHKVNLTNTKVIQSYATETHYETITPSDSLIPNITIPSTLNYDVAIKPSTEYTIRANTSDNLTVDLGGTTGTLSNGKVTLTTPTTLTHNEVKFSGTGKVKELMVVEGNEIKDSVPFFNGMKNVEMGGIKLVNIARGATCSRLVTANTNKTQFTYTSDGAANAYHTIYFDSSLLKTNTVYTVFADITTNTSDASHPIKFQFGYTSGNLLDVRKGFVGKIKQTITSANTTKDGLAIVFRPCSSGGKVVIENPMIIEGDWTRLDEIPFIESEMIIEQPIIRSQGKNLFDLTRMNEMEISTVTSTNNIIDMTNNSVTTTNGNKSTGGRGYKLVGLKKGIPYTVTVTNDRTSETSGYFQISSIDGTDWHSQRRSLGVGTTESWQVYSNVGWLNIGIAGVGESGKTVTFKDIQIEEGSTATSYEPHKHQTLYSNRVIGYEEGCYYIASNGAKTTNANLNSLKADVEGLNVAYVSNTSSNYVFWDKDGLFISGKATLDTASGLVDKDGFITVPTNAKYMTMASSNKDTVRLYTKATVTGELPLRSLPNGVCDTLNLVTGEYVQRVGEFECNDTTIDGEISSKLVENAYSVVFYPKLIFGYDVNFDYDNTKINAERIQCTHPHFDKQDCGMYVNYNNIVLWDRTVSSIQEFKDKYWGMKVQCQLSTPIVRKLGFTAKGNYTETALNLNGWVYSDTLDKTIRFKIDSSIHDIVNTSPIITNDYHIRKYGLDSHGDYEYITNIENTQYVNIKQNKLNSLDVNGFVQWLSQNPIKVGYISSTQSSESYSNIHKPIFFNDVNVQFLPHNLDIQPKLTYQVRTRNSYVMDMMKADTTYTMKCLSYSPNARLWLSNGNANTSVTTNKSFSFAQSSLDNANKQLVIVGQWYEPMIIEGDLTGKNLPYFKGILSSYHDVDEIEVHSVNKNLFDMSKVKPYDYNGTHWWNTIVKENEVVSVRSGTINNGQFGAYIKLDVRPNSVYTLYIEMEKDGEPYGGIIYAYENDDLWGNTTFIGYANSIQHLQTSQNAKYVTIGINYGVSLPIGTTLVSKNMRLYLGEESPIYIPHSHNTTLIEMPTRLETVKVVRPEMENGGIGGSGQNSSTYLNGVRTRDLIPVKPNMLVSVSNNGANQIANWWLYDVNKNFIKKIQHDNSFDSSTLTIPENTYFVRIHRTQSNIDNLILTLKEYKPIQLNSLPNGVCDEIIMKPNSNKAQLVQRVGKVVLDGSEVIATDSVVIAAGYTLNEISTYFKVMPTSFTLQKSPTSYDGQPNMLCDSLVVTSRKESQQTILKSICPYDDGFGMRPKNDVNNVLSLRTYLQQNPITIYYELDTPIIHEIQLKGYPYVYEDGTVTLNTDIPHQTFVSYNVNQEQLISNQNETIIRHDQQIDDLYYYIEMYLEEIYQMELFRMKLELSL